MKKKLLFICTANMDRSPTAENLFKNSENYEAKSAGTSLGAIIKIDQDLIDWADIIFVMSEKEDGHLTYLNENFDVRNKEIHDLDIPDIYNRGDQNLVEMITTKLEKILGKFS